MTLSEQGAPAAPVRRRGFLRRLWRQLRGGETSRGRASASVAVGLFIGCLPLYGLHLPLCLAVCLPLRLDAVTAYIAANISNPLFAPFLVAGQIQAGSLLTRGAWAEIDIDSLDAARVSGLALELALGSLVVGAALAMLGALATWTLLGRVRGAKSALDQAIARTVARYGAAARGDRYYVASKLHADPVLEQIAAQPGDFGRVLDAACGRGQLGLCLLELGRVSTLYGFDSDQRKLDAAVSAAGDDARFELGDLRDAELPIADTLLLIDVLHYLSPDDQAAVLKRAALSLAPGGRLFLRELDVASGIRAWPAMLAERIARLTRYNAGPTLAFSKTSDLVTLLESAGLGVKLEPSGGLANKLIVATRGAGDHGFLTVTSTSV